MKRLYEFLLRFGRSGLELMGAMYVSLLASLLLSTFLNSNYIFASIWVAIFLFLWGFLLSIITIKRYNNYEKKYETSNTINKKDVKLLDFFKTEEEKNKMQYILIYFVWLPALICIFVVGIDIREKANKHDERIERIENKVDSVLNNMFLIYEQNNILSDSLKSNKQLFIYQYEQLDSLAKEFKIFNSQHRRVGK